MFAALGSVASEVVARNRLDDSILVIEGSKSNELEGLPAKVDIVLSELVSQAGSQFVSLSVVCIRQLDSQ